VDGTGSGSCPMVGCGTSGVETSGSTQLYLVIESRDSPMRTTVYR